MSTLATSRFLFLAYIGHRNAPTMLRMRNICYFEIAGQLLTFKNKIYDLCSLGLHRACRLYPCYPAVEAWVAKLFWVRITTDECVRAAMQIGSLISLNCG